jgi:hypothetical protein
MAISTAISTASPTVPHPLGDGPTPAMTPKAAHLATAAAAGLPVPPGFVVGLGAALATEEPIAALLRDGPVIVRSALAIEDGVSSSAAGIGVSRGDVRDVAGYRAAVAEIAAAVPHVDGRDCIVVQRQVVPRVRAVLAIEATQTSIETYATDSTDAFSGGLDPAYSGPLASWPDALASRVDALAQAIIGVFGATPYGLDVELVVAHDDALHLVQVRPLVAPLHPGWADFVAAVARAGDVIPPSGAYVLDAEHNPAPLSFAHAALIRWLAEVRPRTGGLVPLAGWLYTRSRIRDLAGGTAPALDAPDPRAVLVRLVDHVLPAARTRYAAVQHAAATCADDGLGALFDEAFAAFVAMIDVYLGELIPARAGWPVLAADLDDPLCLRDRDAVVDVLPLSWDIASKTVLDLGTRSAEVSAVRVAVPEEPAAAATLLREWDDHLFALGMAPVRAVYLQIGERTRLGDLVFELDRDECSRAIAGEDLAPVARARAEARERAADLSPPVRIVDGRPAGVAPRWLRGMPIGPSFVGRVVQRRDLAALGRDPPGPDAVVCLPSLTAVAAIVLRDTGVRAVCCEHGGALSHAALMARELGLSALIGCRGCTALPDGTAVLLDTTTGALRRVHDDAALGRPTSRGARVH